MSPDELLRDADLAMYVAKRKGKGRYEMYQPKMHEDALRRLETEVGIREGLETNQFEVFYQPIVDTHSGGLIAAEALVRWNHPSRGLLAPIEFITVAEDTGLIVPLGEQVLSRRRAPDAAVETVTASSIMTSTSASTSRPINSRTPDWSTAWR